VPAGGYSTVLVHSIGTAQFRGGNNGDLDLTVGKARLYAISHKELAAGIPLLEQVGLIERTRQGRLAVGKKLCSLYALTCWPTDPSDKYDQPLILQRRASEAWAKWSRPPDWGQVVRLAKRKAAGRKIQTPHGKIQTPHGGNGSHPHVGNGNDAHHSPRAERLLGNSVPHVRYSSQDLGPDMQDQVEKFIAIQPNMSDVDVAIAFRWKVNQFEVARIRQALNGGPNGPGT
jgi:hypothetical protein